MHACLKKNNLEITQYSFVGFDFAGEFHEIPEGATKAVRCFFLHSSSTITTGLNDTRIFQIQLVIPNIPAKELVFSILIIYYSILIFYIRYENIFPTIVYQYCTTSYP